MSNSQSSKLTLMGALILSLSAIAPTGAMAFNTTASARFAGINVPLSFIFALIAILLVGSCFASMAKNVSGAGSVYAYNQVALGEKAGFITGWILTLTYIVGSAANGAMSANFLNVFLGHLNIGIPMPILAIGLIIIAWMTSLLGLKLTTWIALITEFVSIIIMGILAIIILTKGGASGSITAQPFIPHGNFTGIGQGMIYALICFAGFEEATAVSTRIKNPRRTIPIAIILCIVVVGIMFLLISYVQIVGFGNSGEALANSQAPLNALTTKYMGSGAAVVMDFATLLSKLASFLGIVNACSYMFYALAKQGYLPKVLGQFNDKLKTPKNAVHTTAIIDIILYVLIGLPVGVQTMYSDLMGIGGLCFLSVYILVCIGTIFYFKKHSKKISIFKHVIVPILGIIVLLFPLSSMLYPIPSFPTNLYPYLIIGWVIIGFIVSRNHIAKNPLDEN